MPRMKKLLPSQEQIDTALKYAKYILATYSSYTTTAKVFGVTKSNVADYLRRYLKPTYPDMYQKLLKIREGNMLTAYKKGNEYQRTRYAITRNALETHILSHLVNNEFYEVYTKELEKILKQARTSIRRHVINYLNEPDCPIVVVREEKKYGWYVFGVKGVEPSEKINEYECKGFKEIFNVNKLKDGDNDAEL